MLLSQTRLMENKRNPIDQTFHSLANHSSSEIPDELNWENMGPDIIAAINSKKRKRRITLFWFWGMAGIIALSVALVTFPVSTSDEDETTDLLENKSDLISLPKVMEQAKVDITSPSTTSPTRDLSHLHGQSTKADQYQVQQEGGEPQNGDVVQRNSLEMTNNINLKSVKNPKNNTRETNTGITRAIQTLPKDEQTEPSSTHYFTLNHSVVSRIDQSSITLIPLETTIEQIRFASPRFQIEHNSMVDPTKSSWWLDIYGGLNGFSSAYQSTNQQGVVPNRESNLAGWTAGLRVTRAKHRLMHFGFGIELNQLNYRFTNELFESTNLYRPNTIDTIIIQPFGLDSTIITRDSVPGTRHIRAQNYNSHKFLKVPLFVGLHHNWKNFDVALQVGVNLQVFRSTTGKTATRFPASIDLAADEFYQNAVGVSVFGEVQCVWKIQSQFHLVFGMGGEKSTSNWLNSNIGLKQRPLIYHARLGLRFAM